MSTLSRINGLHATELSGAEYHAVLTTAGYEARSTHIAEAVNPLARIRTACSFSERQVGCYERNVAAYRNMNFEVPVIAEDDVAEWTRNWFQNVVRENSDCDRVRVCVDISCMSRIRIASILAALLELQDGPSVDVDFLYSIAKFVRPVALSAPNVSAQPVLSLFAGWNADLSLPITALIGLGYEPGKAIGSFEYLEATNVWTFCPIGDDDRYDRAVKKANASLLDHTPKKQNVFYRLDQPLTCFGTLESIVYGLLPSQRPVLLPFGPKIFALVAMLVACVHREVPVWRISSGQSGSPEPREASGKILGLRVAFDTAKETIEMTDGMSAGV
ncbi:MAG: hypothetical protein QM775_15645 [Pirellulales bacterium]